MNTGLILKTSLISSIVFVLVGSLFKIMHYPNADILLIMGLICSLILIITGIYEVRTSKRISGSEKTMWTIGFLFMSGIVGIVYVLSGRKRIAPLKVNSI